MSMSCYSGGEITTANFHNSFQLQMPGAESLCAKTKTAVHAASADAPQTIFPFMHARTIIKKQPSVLSEHVPLPC
jgi:hypothetical protein